MNVCTWAALTELDGEHQSSDEGEDDSECFLHELPDRGEVIPYVIGEAA